MSSEPNQLVNFTSHMLVNPAPGGFDQSFRCIAETDLEQENEVRDYLFRNNKSFDWLRSTLNERSILFSKLLSEEPEQEHEEREQEDQEHKTD